MKRKVHLLTKIVLLFLVFTLSFSKDVLSQSSNINVNRNREFVKVYGRLLSKHVKMKQTKDGIKTSLVDYRAIRKDPDWITAKELIRRINVEKMTSPAYRLAFWINAYNFYLLSLITNKYPLKSITDLNRTGVEVWDTYRFKIYGKRYNLRTIKDKKILGQFNDSRILFSLACSGLSCPDLWNKPYTGIKLKQQLNSQARKFLANKTKGANIVNMKGKVSELFRIYKKNIYSGNVTRFISNYVIILRITGYLKFNWNLNSIDENQTVLPNNTRY